MQVLWVVLVLALCFAAFAAAAETSLTSVSRLRMRSMAEEGSRRARRVVRLHNDPNAYLSTILALNTVAVIIASTSATSLAFDTNSFPEWLATLTLAAFVLVFCEIAPKSLALRYNERLALMLARPVGLLTIGLRPIIGSLTIVSTLLLRATGRRVPPPFVTEEELKMLVTVGEQEGVVEQEEREMIHGILEMTDKAVREIMVPRVDVVAIQSDKDVSDVISIIIEHGHSRVPIYEETVDQIVGVVYAKDLLKPGVRGATLRSLAREAYYTPETKHVGELLHEMQDRRVHIAIVVDEHGGTAGIVTMEDLIEEIVGPIRDEYDIAEQEDVQFLSESEVLMSARMPIDDVQEMLHLTLEEVEADSIGGYVYAQLGEIPKAGATLAIGDATLTVEAVRRQAIRTVRITSPHPFLRDRNGMDDDDDDNNNENLGVANG